MTNPIFQPTDFNSMVNLVVGDCNGVKGHDRWALETPIFTEAISRYITEDTKVVLDYGCGVGRLARAMMEANPGVELIGIDDSPKQLQAALAYVNDERFEALLPQELNRPVDLIYCVYVLQHIPAIDLREALQRMHHYLKPGGTIVICSSDYRMSVRFDRPAFFDDRFLGVNIRNEVSRYFELQGPLFTDEDMETHPVLKQLILAQEEGDSEKKGWVAHPAYVYKRRELDVPAFNAPYVPIEQENKK